MLFLIGTVLFTFLLLQGIAVVQRLMKLVGWLAKAKKEKVESWVDRLEMFETVVFSVQLTTSIRICLQVIAC